MVITLSSPWVALLVAAVLSLATYAARLWLKRYIETAVSEQVTHANAAKLAALQSELANRSHVHRVQAELEIRAYGRIWSRMLQLDISTRALEHHPPVPKGEPEPAEYGAALEGARLAYNRFFDAMEIRKPFYPQSVFSALANVRQTVRMEDLDRSMSVYGSHRPPAALRLYDARTAVLASIDAACEAIRARLAELTLIRQQ